MIPQAAVEADQAIPFGTGKEPGQQGSLEWLYERLGLCTASRFKDAIDTLKNGKSSAKREAYKWELVIERITGQPVQHYESTAMQHGTENEPMARMAYCSKTGAFVDEVGFYRHSELMAGGSPDGLIDEDGGIEIKCPFNSANHLQCFLTEMPEEHIPQVQGLMWLLGRQWWDFISFDHRMPAPMDIYIQRIPRDDKYIDETLVPGIVAFLDEVQALQNQLTDAKKAALTQGTEAV